MREKAKRIIAILIAAVTFSVSLPYNVFGNQALYDDLRERIQVELDFLRGEATDFRIYKREKYGEEAIGQIWLRYQNEMFLGNSQNFNRAVAQWQAYIDYRVFSNLNLNIRYRISSIYNLASSISLSSINSNIKGYLRNLVVASLAHYTSSYFLTFEQFEAELIRILNAIQDHVEEDEPEEDEEKNNDHINRLLSIRHYLERALEMNNAAKNFYSFRIWRFYRTSYQDYLTSVLWYIDHYPTLPEELYTLLDISDLNNLRNTPIIESSDYFRELLPVLISLRNILETLVNNDYNDVFIYIFLDQDLNSQRRTGTSIILDGVNEAITSLHYVIESIYYVEKAAIELIGFIPRWNNYYYWYSNLPYFVIEHSMYHQWITAYMAGNSYFNNLEMRGEYLNIMVLYIEGVVDLGLSEEEALYRAETIFWHERTPSW